MHAALHTPLLYKRVHKIHHEFKNPIAFSCVYAHWFEFVFVNLLSGYVADFMLKGKAHMVTNALESAFILFDTHEDHSGYAFPYSPFESPISRSKFISRS